MASRCAAEGPAFESPWEAVARTGEFLDDDANFSSLGVAFLTLFRCSTGGDWNGLMHDVMITEATHPGRCSDAHGTCGSPAASAATHLPKT